VATSTPARTMLVVRPGDEVDSVLLGGKAASLWRLSALGFPVPRFAVVTTEAYALALGTSRLHELIAGLPDPTGDDESQRHAIDDAFAALELPATLVQQVIQAAHEVAGLDGALAVRSSATAEDLRDVSFAGQYQSFLDVRGDEAVLRALRLTWASLWHPAARRYRAEHDVDDTGVGMAVLLMELIRPELAGVAFTKDPAGDEDDVRIEVVTGFADRLVAGEATPAAFVVPRGDPRAAGSPVAAQVARLALDAEAALGYPQDVEWAWDGTRLHLVQSRPITVLDNAGDDGFDTATIDGSYTTAGIAEMLPGGLPPLVWDTAGRAIDDALLTLFGDLGALPDEPVAGAIARVHAQAVVDLGLLARAANALPGTSPENLQNQLLGGAPETGNATGQARVPLWRRLSHDLRVVRLRNRAVSQGDVFLLAVPQIVEAGVELEALDDDALLAYRARLVDLLGRGARAEVAVAACAAAAYDRLEAFLGNYVPPSEASTMVGRLTRSVPTAAAVRRWMDLAHQARSWPGGRDALHETEWSDALTHLRGGDPDAEAFLSAFARAVRAAGSRACIAGATWEEEPDAAWRAVRAAAERHSSRPDDTLTVQDTQRLLATTARWRRLGVVAGLVIDTQALLLRRHVEDATDLLRRRDDVKGALLSLGGEIRRLHLEVGRRLVDRGLLHRRGDVDHLGAHELVDALGSRVPAHAELLRRKRRFEQAAATALPVEFSGRAAPMRRAAPAGDRFIGWAASGGTYEGVARVVHSSTDHFEPGEILVARTTDPSWGPLFLTAGALVVEQGGPLSHAAVVARELGLPAVVNVPGVVDRIGSGPARVRVDGTSGEVVVLAPSEAER
jgi:rifampicin phosphotransferase